MAALAAICGVLIVAFGLVSTSRAPSAAELAIEVTAFVGGILLCFLAVVLSRLTRLERKLEGMERQLGGMERQLGGLERQFEDAPSEE